jgi:hypothetical protein
VAGNDRGKTADPLGKRALFWVPSASDAIGEATHPASSSAIALPVGKRALYSGARPEPDSVRATSDNPLADRGIFSVECERCRQVSRIGLLDLLIYQFPMGAWLPRGTFDRRMTCPSCRRRAWCSVSLRHD